MTDLGMTDPTPEQLITMDFFKEIINGEPTTDPLVDVARTALLWYIEQRSHVTNLDTNIGAMAFSPTANSDTFTPRSEDGT